MGPKLWVLALTSLVHSAFGASVPPTAESDSCRCEGGEIEYDVAIIGGGSSGTYAAIQLQKAGKSVVVIEKNDRLGGHVNTYIDPVTNGTMDYGVINYINTTTAQEYFNYLQIPTEPFMGFTDHPETDIAAPLWADFQAATVVSGGAQLPSQNETADVARYAAFENQPEYAAWTGGTGYTYLPDPVPDELFLPFSQWLQTHDFPAIAYQEWYQGAGNVLEQMALYMLKYIDKDYADGRVIVGHHDNQLLYDTALAKLQEQGSTSKVFLNSHPIRIIRHTNEDEGIEVAFQDNKDHCTTIRARQLVLAIPPLYADLVPFLDMHTAESSLFSKFVNITYWAAVVTDTGVPANTGISNVVLDAVANIPGPFANLGLTPSSIENRDLHATWWVAQQQLSEEEVTQLLIESSSNATTAFNFTPPAGRKMSVAALESHTPYLLTVSKEDIQDGFYKKLTSLQGQRGTWYTGSAWESEDSAAIWNYTLYQVLPGILSALD